MRDMDPQAFGTEEVGEVTAEPVFLSRECRNGLGAVDAAMQREAHDEENGLRVGHRGCGRRLGFSAGKFPEGFGGDDRRHPVRDAHDLRRRVSRGGQKRRHSTEIAGVLRLPIGKGPFPAVVLIEGSGGIGNNDGVEIVSSLPHGIATFTNDRFTGRGIVSLVVDQSKLV